MNLFETTAIDTSNSSRLPTTSQSFPPVPITETISAHLTVARYNQVCLSTWVITSRSNVFFLVEPPGIVCLRRSGGCWATGPVYCVVRRSLATDLRLESMFPCQFLMVSLANTPNPKCNKSARAAIHRPTKNSSYTMQAEMGRFCVVGRWERLY